MSDSRSDPDEMCTEYDLSESEPNPYAERFAEAVPILREVHGVEDADARRELMKSLVDYLSNARDQVERRELEDAVRQVFRRPEGEEIMVTIGEAWMRDGAVAQARKSVLEAVQVRFREVPPGLQQRVYAIEDLDVLEQLLRDAITGESVEAFQREVELALTEGPQPGIP